MDGVVENLAICYRRVAINVNEKQKRSTEFDVDIIIDAKDPGSSQTTPGSINSTTPFWVWILLVLAIIIVIALIVVIVIQSKKNEYHYSQV